MIEPTHVFLDFEPDMPQSNLAAEARFGLVAFRKRPPDKGCAHPSVTFGTPHNGMVDCVCDNPECGLEWRMVKLVEPKGAVR